jgi:hypothetical protein
MALSWAIVEEEDFGKTGYDIPHRETWAKDSRNDVTFRIVVAECD